MKFPIFVHIVMLVILGVFIMTCPGAREHHVNHTVVMKVAK